MGIRYHTLSHVGCRGLPPPDCLRVMTDGLPQPILLVCQCYLPGNIETPPDHLGACMIHCHSGLTGIKQAARGGRSQRGV